MVGLPGTPYFFGDSDLSAQLIGTVKTGDTDKDVRVYWASPESQGSDVVRDLLKYTGEKPHAQWSIPEGFTPHMRGHVESLRDGTEYRSERPFHDSMSRA